MGNTYSQAFPPAPKFTEKNLPDLTGKVYLITGANSGLGKELAGLLYSHNATVYLGCRSQDKANEAIGWISEHYASSADGRLIFLALDLADLASVKAAAVLFRATEQKLHVLFHNAGVLTPPRGSKTKQGHELQLGVHAVGPFLLTSLLEPVLKATAAAEGPSRVRVVWVASVATHAMSPPGGVVVDKLGDLEQPPLTLYGVSKAGTYFLAGQFAKRLREHGIISVSLDPGNLKTGLQTNLKQEAGSLVYYMSEMVLHPAIKGAYTELFAGLSPAVTLQTVSDASNWVQPWGRIKPMPRKDLVAAFRPSERGQGNAVEFYDWCEKQVQSYL